MKGRLLLTRGEQLHQGKTLVIFMCQQLFSMIVGSNKTMTHFTKDGQLRHWSVITRVTFIVILINQGNFCFFFQLGREKEKKKNNKKSTLFKYIYDMSQGA